LGTTQFWITTSRAEDALFEALSLMPNEHDYYAIDTDLAALVDQVGQLRADLQLVPLT
jgi:hypothetical protein